MIVAAAIKHNGVNYTGARHCNIFKQILADGKLGSVWQVRHWASQPLEHAKSLVSRSPFYLDPAGGGLYMGFTVHNFDLVRWLVGADVSTVYAQVKQYGDHPIHNLSMMAQLGFYNGVTAQIWVNLEMPGETFNRSAFRTQIVGEKGLLDFDGYDHLDLKSDDGWQRIWEQPAFDLSNPQDPVRLEAYSKMVQEYIDDGNLVPDKLVIRMVEIKIRSHTGANGFIFDGFPRTDTQAVALDEMLEKRNMPITAMLALEVDDDELRVRIRLRSKTSGRADDQNDEKINNRIRVYKEETLPVAKYYAKQSKYHGINGVGSIDEIFNDICMAIDLVK